MEQDKKRRSPWRRLRNIVIGIGVVLLFAYAVQVTRVNLEEPLEPQRQDNLVGLIRELAQPDLFDHETETRRTEISMRMPCPEVISGSQVSFEGRTLLLAPNCASTTQDVLTLSGEGFPSNVQGNILWQPIGAATTRNLGPFRANNQGTFESDFTMPDIRETEEPQRLVVVEILNRRIVGPSDTTVETVEKILETILMALMASTIGTVLAVPISFMGARNIMQDVGLPLAAIMAALIAIPIGAFLGLTAGQQLSSLALLWAQPVLLNGGAMIVAGLLAVVALRIGLPLRSSQGAAGRLAGLLLVVIAALLGYLALVLLAQLGIIFGAWLETVLGFFGFIGNFIFVLSDFLRVTMPWWLGFLTALISLSAASRAGQEAILSISDGAARILTTILTFIGTVAFIFGVMYAANWICFFGLCRVTSEDPATLLLTLAIPSLAGGLIAALLSLRVTPKWQVPVGMFIYSVTRTILNVLRAIEPVIMGFVLVVWVGIGPFAGVLALMLHSVADLGKLFSEQVENIDEGPLEAVTATGANRIQTISFAVVPQIIPHYLAFIFYRWDINVRLSTIIGFVGGGGIGLLLFRSTNLTQYKQASVMIIAIAIVVTTLDFFSSRIRRRII